LSRQNLESFEVLLIDSTPGADHVTPIASRFPFARCHRHPHQLGAHAARNVGARMAQGHLLAFMDPDMTADPDWLERLRAAWKPGENVVGGGVDCPPGYWPMAVHVTKYGWWIAGGKPRAVEQLPSGNFCIPRELYLEMGGFPDTYWEGDTELSYRLRQRGFTLWQETSARTIHFDAPPLRGFLRERWLRGYDTGKARMRRHGWTPAERAVRIAAAPAVWALMMWRSLVKAAEREWLWRWVASSPVVAAGLLSWVLGECVAHGEGVS
jgi:GT2 family glycosyltransferase